MTIKSKVKELWKLCFDDSDAFTELYFRLRYSNKVNITIQSGDEIIAALQMLPYPMTFCGNEINTAYISGACTHPDYRGKGIMRELLSQSFAQMTRKGVPVTTLIPAEPWLFDYYKSMGYAPVFHYSEIKLLPENIEAPGNTLVKEITGFDKAVYEYLNAQMHQRICCVQHDEADFRVVLEDLALSGGKIYAAYENDKIAGVLFADPKEDNLLRINEIFAKNEDIKKDLLHRASIDFKPEKISIPVPPDTDVQSRPMGMARIIYAKAILQLYASANPDKELNIELNDKQLSLNNGYYYVVNGKCMTTKKRLPGSHMQMSISELTEMVFAPANPYMSLMLN